MTPKDYYPLLVFQVGRHDITRRRPKSMKRDFRALGKLIKGSGTQTAFSSIPSVVGMDEEEYRRSQQMNLWLQDCCYRQGFGFFNHGLVYRTPDFFGIRWDAPVPEGEKDLGAGISWAH